ncbi:MAG TPA: hypothetical protein VF056_13885 [Thermoleophilaceae bacterium]
MTTRDVLRLRNFRLLFVGHGVSVFGDRMVTVALAFAVLEVSAAVGIGALLGSLAATRVRPSRPLVSVALMDASVACRWRSWRRGSPRRSSPWVG